MNMSKRIIKASLHRHKMAGRVCDGCGGEIAEFELGASARLGASTPVTGLPCLDFCAECVEAGDEILAENLLEKADELESEAARWRELAGRLQLPTCREWEDREIAEDETVQLARKVGKWCA
jgi:hypothetical protein